MDQPLTDSAIEDLFLWCRAGLERQFLPTPAGAEVRRLDIAAVLDNLVWKILAPIIVSVTGGTIHERLKRRRAGGASEADPQLEARSAVGNRLEPINAADYSACVAEVEEVIGALGGTREQAERLVAAVVRKLGDGKPGRPESDAGALAEDEREARRLRTTKS